MTTTTVHIGSAELADRQRPDVATEPDDHPGRWVGGALGAILSLVAAVVAHGLRGGAGGDDVLTLDWTLVGLMGMPIGFALGRALFPTARAAGWRRALAVGMLLGGIAPPLGAIEVLGTAGLVGDSTSSIAGASALILLPIALPVSYVAIAMTLPVGLAWGVLARLVPEDAVRHLRVPGWLARLGIRHALAVLVPLVLVLDGLRLGRI